MLSLGLVILGGEFFYYTWEGRNPFGSYALVPLVFVALLPTLSLLQFFTGLSVNPERYLIGLVFSVGTRIDGALVMSPVAAANFLLIGTAMALLLIRPRPGRTTLGATLSTLAVFFSLVFLLGYLYGTPLLYGGKVRPIALPGVLGFIALGTSLIASAGTEHFPLRLLIGPSVRSILLRTYFLIIFIVALTDILVYHLLRDLKLTEALLSALSTLSYLIVGTILMSQFARVVGRVMDRAEEKRRRAEEELRRNLDHLEELVRERTADLSRSNAELEQFAYVASHDLREPLLAVGSNLKLLERRIRGRVSAEADKFAAEAMAAVLRMEALISDLLTYSRAGTQRQPFETVRTEEVLQAVLANLKTSLGQSQAELTFDALPEIKANPVQFMQLFQNLITNALKFRREERPRIHISAGREPGKWVFSVRDNGLGVPPEEKERIFEMFHRLHKEKIPGTGIGLATCRKIVEGHGGRIWVDSQPGQGSTFFFTVPDPSPEGLTAV
jgi:signal transduction histidine kinase